MRNLEFYLLFFPFMDMYYIYSCFKIYTKALQMFHSESLQYRLFIKSAPNPTPSQPTRNNIRGRALSPPPARYHRPVEYRTVPYLSPDVWRHPRRQSPKRHGSPPRHGRHVSPPYRHKSPPRQAAPQHRYSPSPHREEFMTSKYRGKGRNS